eukprot:930340-Amorphochlora_amoeboformis.AAC.1
MPVQLFAGSGDGQDDIKFQKFFFQENSLFHSQMGLSAPRSTTSASSRTNRHQKLARLLMRNFRQRK